MDRKKINLILAAILETLSEVDEAADGWVYAALTTQGVTLEEFNLLRGLLVESGCVDVPCSHVIRISDKGRELVAKIH